MEQGTAKDIPPWLQPVPEHEEESTGLASKKVLIATIAGAVVIIALFVSVILYLYDGTANQPPIRVEAPKEPIKEKPEDPGGMEVDHRDKQIFEQSDGVKPRGQVELGAQPEKPLAEIPQDEVKDDPVGDMIEATTDAVEEAQQTPEPRAETTQTPKVEEQKPVAKPAVEDKPAPAQPAPTASVAAFRIQLGAYGSEQSAARAWRAVRGKFPERLRDMTPEYEAVQAGDRTLFRLRVGPYSTRADADQVCLALRANEQACMVVNP